MYIIIIIISITIIKIIKNYFEYILLDYIIFNYIINLIDNQMFTIGEQLFE